jgi:hypothetical protein
LTVGLAMELDSVTDVPVQVAEMHAQGVAVEHLVACPVLAEAVDMIDGSLLHELEDVVVHEPLDEADNMSEVVGKDVGAGFEN